MMVLALVLSSCNAPDYKGSVEEYTLLPLDSLLEDSTAAALIAPYSAKMGASLKDTLCYLPVAMSNGRSDDQSPEALWKWSAGAALAGWRNHGNQADGCLLNRGGLRTSWDPGWLLVEDVYEMMPFENRLVLVYLNKQKQKELAAYIASQNHPMVLPEVWGDTLAVVTTDYLANGGDHMDFFVDQPKKSSNLLLREIFMEEARTDTLNQFAQ